MGHSGKVSGSGSGSGSHSALAEAHPQRQRINVFLFALRAPKGQKDLSRIFTAWRPCGGAGIWQREGGGSGTARHCA